MNDYKKYYIMRFVVTALFGVILGVLFLVARPYAVEIFDILLIAMGLLTAVMNLPSFLFSLFHVNQRGEWINLVVSAAAIAFGILLMLVRRDVILLVLGIFSVIFPIVRVSLVEEHKKRFKRELPNILFGLFMVFVSLAQAEELVFFVCGIAVLVFTVLYLLWHLITMRWRFAAYEAYLQELAEREQAAQQ